MDKLITKVWQWGWDRKIIQNGNPMTQAIKTLEECHELIRAIDLKDEAEIDDAIGDIIVTLIMVCGQRDVDIQDMLEGSYNVIKDRTGHLNKNGDFIRDKPTDTPEWTEDTEFPTSGFGANK